MADLEYGYEKHDKRHMWWVKGPSGGVHIWASPTHEESRMRWGEHYYGGIEMHSRKQLYDWNKGPDHDDCWLLKGPCWHDGSSLQFSEQIEPMMRGVDDLRKLDGMMNSILFDRYTDWFPNDVEPAKVEFL